MRSRWPLRKRRSLAVALWLCATCAALIPAVSAVATSGELKQHPLAWLFVLLFAALAGAAESLRRRLADSPGSTAAGAAGEQDDTRLDRAARDVATAVAGQWELEAAARSLYRPKPLRVRWSSTGRPVAATASAVLGREIARSSWQRLTLQGDLADLVGKFRLLPARQLVVLGEPGAGKTVLAILLTRQLLDDAEPDEPVPVLLPLSSWNPHHEHLHDWLTRRLVEEHPALANTGAYGPDAAARLVAQVRVMPVLDGLDELPPGLHAAAIQALDGAIAHDRPLVVTCRSAEYQAAVRQGGAILARAAVVEIEPVEPAEAMTYLTARQPAGDFRWKRVDEHLGTNPDGVLAQALSTPLMVDLARTAYTKPDTDPGELCDTNRFPDRATIEQHLLDAFLPAVYAPLPLPSAPGAEPGGFRPCRLEQAHRWLTFLAVHMGRMRTRDLAWWQLHHAVPRAVRGLASGLAQGLAFGLAGALGDAMSYGPRFGLPPGALGGLGYGLFFGAAGVLAGMLRQRAAPSRVEIRSRGAVRPFLLRAVVGLVVGVASAVAVDVGLLAGFAGGLAFGLALGVEVWVNTPTDAATVSRPSAVLRQDRTATLLFALGIGLALGLVTGLMVGLMGGPAGGLVFGLASGLVNGVAGALVFGLAYERTVALAYGLVFGLVGAFAGGIADAPAGGLGGWLVFGLVYGLAVAIGVGLSRAWGRFVISRMCLALRGHLPWRLMRFLADARRRGVLRQAGGVYQFRHARLQDRLAGMG